MAWSKPTGPEISVGHTTVGLSDGLETELSETGVEETGTRER